MFESILESGVSKALSLRKSALPLARPRRQLWLWSTDDEDYESSPLKEGEEQEGSALEPSKLIVITFVKASLPTSAYLLLLLLILINFTDFYYDYYGISCLFCYLNELDCEYESCDERTCVCVCANPVTTLQRAVLASSSVTTCDASLQTWCVTRSRTVWTTLTRPTAVSIGAKCRRAGCLLLVSQ